MLISDVQGKCSGFVDTLPRLKKLYPARKNLQTRKSSETLLDTEYQARDALADVRALKAFIDTRRITDIGAFSFSCSYMHKTVASSDKTKEPMCSLNVVPQ